MWFEVYIKNKKSRILIVKARTSNVYTAFSQPNVSQSGKLLYRYTVERFERSKHALLQEPPPYPIEFVCLLTPEGFKR